MQQVQATPTSRCYSVVLGKVYNLQGFAPHHYGGQDEIQEHCRQDITDDFFGKPFHTLVQFVAIQDFQKGVIEGGTADPCSANYVPNPDGSGYGGDSVDGGDKDDSEDSDD
jgi:hypothetical protein